MVEALDDFPGRDRLFRALFDQSPDANWMLDEEDRFAVANASAARLLGYAVPAQVLHLHPWEISPPRQPDGRPSAEKAAEMIARARAAGTHRFEWLHLRADGATIPVEVTLSAFDVGRGRWIHCIGRDIRDAKQAENTLRSQRAFVSEVLQRASDGVAVGCDSPTFPYVEFPIWNQRMVELTGYTRDEINTLGWDQAMYPEPEVQARAAARVERLRAGDDLDAEEWVVTTKSGERRTLSISTGRVALDDGRPAVVASMRDVTERHRAAAERERLRAQLEATQRLDSIGRLAGGVAHDFNNMLGVILGRATLALDHLDAQAPRREDLRGELREIVDAAQRSADLTRQLLAFARRQAVAPVELDLCQRIGALASMLRRLIGENIRLDFQPSAAPAVVRLDPSQLDQILTNLCANARDAIGAAGRDTGTIRIGLSATEAVAPEWAARRGLPSHVVTLRIDDDGCGMAEDVQRSAFEPFFTTKAQGQGNGLGLATVYGIVKQNGGHIDLESQPGRGTTLRLHFPGLHASAPTPAPGWGAPGPSGTEVVLFVEDEPAVLRMGQRMLERAGYTVLAAAGGAQALAVADAFPGAIALLVTDVIMPEMGGLALATRLRAVRPHLRVLFVSGYAADAIAEQGVLSDDVNFLAKPFSPGELTAKVRVVLEA